MGNSGTPSDNCESVCIKELMMMMTTTTLTKKKSPVKHYFGFWLKLLSNLKRVCVCV